MLRRTSIRTNLIFSTLISCTTTNPTAPTSSYSNMDTGTLWEAHSSNSSPLELALIEAQLGIRGQTKSGTDYLGKSTSGNYGQHLYTRPVATDGAKNCSDFPNAAAAQLYFLARGGPVSDRDNLDRDGDGLACEWGTYIRQIAHRYYVVPKPVYSSHSYSSSSSCYTGPKGGRYTLTASGRKNYGGC